MQTHAGNLPNSSPDNHPLALLAEPPRGSHLVLFHEEDSYDEVLEFWYMVHGLAKGEDAIYLTLDDPENVRRRMRKRGIDVDYYEKERRLLHITKFRDPAKHPDGFSEGMREMYHSAFGDVGRPCRVVGASVPEIQTEEQIKLNIEVESDAMAGFQGKASKGSIFSVFDNFPGSVLCHYNISRNPSEAQSWWVSQNEKCHHLAIYAPRNRKIIVRRGGLE